MLNEKLAARGLPALLKMNAEKGLEKRPHCDAMVFEAVALTEEILRQRGVICD